MTISTPSILQSKFGLVKVLVLILTEILFSFQVGSASTYDVGAGFPYTSIKAAVEVAIDGDSVLVHGGVYKEGNIILDKSISFIGMDWPVLDGQKKYEVLSVKANHVLITGFKIQFSGHASLDDPCGIKVYNSRNVRIIGNQLFGAIYPITISGTGFILCFRMTMPMLPIYSAIMEPVSP